MIELEKVEAVLFTTGWQAITPGTFEAVELDYGAGGPPPEPGFRFVDQSSGLVWAALSAVLAVRCSP